MTKAEVPEAIASLQADGWAIIDVVSTRTGYAVIAADTVDDHVSYETLADALSAGIA